VSSCFVPYILLIVNAHCPPIGPLHDKCSKNDDSDSSSTSSSSSSSTVTYSENVSNQNAAEGTQSGQIGNGFSRFSILMIIAAAVAAMFAMMAIVAGMKQQGSSTHPLKGSVARRKTLFQSFTDCALCDTLPVSSSSNAAENAQQRHLEMVDSRDAYDRCNV
jgi:hypothetical protein